MLALVNALMDSVLRRRGGAIRLDEKADAADWSSAEKDFRCTAPDSICVDRQATTASEDSTVSDVLTWCALICGWLEGLRYLTKLDDGGARYLLRNETAAILVVPLLAACIAAAAASATAPSFRVPLSWVIRVCSTGVFALPWIFTKLCVDVGSQWRSASFVFGLLVYQLALILWSHTLREEWQVFSEQANPTRVPELPTRS